MIQIGTLCIILFARHPRFVGRQCVVTGHHPDERLDHDIIVPNEPSHHPSGQWAAARAWLLPIAPPGNPDKVDEREPVEAFR